METTKNGKNTHLRLSNEESNRLTRECLQTALILLIAEKNFQDITITELVKRSGVSRMAFYRNYSSKEDIILDLYTHELQKLEQSMNLPQYINDPYSWLLQYFEGIQKEYSMFSVLSRCTLPPELNASLSNITRNLFPADTPEERYGNIAIQSAFSAIVKEWILTEMQESPEEMAQLCLSLYRNRPTLNRKL